MLDLRQQHESISQKLHDAVWGAVADGILISTESVTPFEQKLARYCKKPYAVGVGNCTGALHFALIAGGVRSGHEVITVPNSFFATAEVILHVGAKPKFVDVDPDTHLISVAKLADAITAKTRAIIPVHLYGNAVDVDAIYGILQDKGREDIIVIEDCAHAMGAMRNGQPVPLGNIGAFSFNPVKNIGALGDAGAVVTSEQEVARAIRLLRDHGRTEKNIHSLAGFNSRLSRINDRVLEVKIDYLDEWNEQRRAIARTYEKNFSSLNGLLPVRVPKENKHAYYQYVVRTPKRNLLREYLAINGIDTAIHYPKLIPEQEPLRRLGYTLSNLPAASRLNSMILSLPCYPGLTSSQVNHVTEQIMRWAESQI